MHNIFQLQVKHLSFQSSEFKISPFKSQSVSKIPTLTISSVNFLRSYWEIINTNVNIMNSDTSQLMLSISSLASNRSIDHQVYLNVENCTFGSWLFRSISNIRITNCTISDRNSERYKTMLSIYNSLVWMKFISVENVTGDKIIHVDSESNVTFELSTFVRNNANFGLLKIEGGSTVYFESCDFSENIAVYGGITFLSDSTIQIKYSHFHNNSALKNGGVICAFSMSTVTIYNSSFIGNKAGDSGGAFYGELYATVTIMSSLFLSNRATAFHNINEGGAISCKNACFLTCLDCSFIQNYAGMIEATKVASSKENVSIGGAVSVSDKSTLHMVNIKFLSNQVSNYGGAIVAADFTNVLVSNSSFENSEAFTGAAIHVRVRSSVEISKSSFYNNSASHGAVATVTDSSQMNVSFSVMTSNHAASAGCFFLIYESTAMVSNCLFERNSAQYLAGAIHVANASTLDVMNSTFTKNLAGPDGGSAIATDASTSINIDGSSFSHNEGSSLCIKLSSIARIENSWIDNTKSDLHGAVVVARNSTLYLTNVTLVDNVVEGSGGALFVQMKSKVEINNCTFSNNKASAQGGSIVVVLDSIILINNTTFSNNTSKFGGAISCTDNTNTTISHSLFVNNQASDSGGAVIIGNKNGVEMFLCKFAGNTAAVSGGAIQNFFSSLKISNSLFENNSVSTNGGGAINVANLAILIMTNSICSGNQALRITSSGGAIEATNEVSMFLQNVTFQNNIAQQTGGGLAIGYSSIVQIINCTFANNNVNVYHGGAIFIERDSLITIHDSVFYNNKMQQQGCIYVSQSLAYFQNSLITNNIVKGPDASSDGAGLYALMSQIRISRSIFTDNIAKRGQDLCAEKSSIFTYQVTFHTFNNTLKSTDKKFEEKALKENRIHFRWDSAVLQETPYSSSKYVSKKMESLLLIIMELCQAIFAFLTYKQFNMTHNYFLGGRLTQI